VRRRAYSGEGLAGGLVWRLVALSCTSAVLLWSGGPNTAGEFRMEPTAASGVDAGAQWREACGRCHLAFDAYFLPASGWARVLGGLPQHFGVSLVVPAAELRQLWGWAERNAADAGSTVIGAEVMNRLAPTDRPQRVTETRWFRHRHHSIPRASWSRPAIGSPAHCRACHPDADRGIFSARSVFIPG